MLNLQSTLSCNGQTQKEANHTIFESYDLAILQTHE